MTAKLIEEIENEIKRVDERIQSKEVLLEESPEDIGLQLSILDFEDKKEDLIRELADIKSEPNIYTKYIKERLGKTQRTLFETRNSQALNPENDLSSDIEYLELVEKGLINELEYCYLKRNIPVYELKLKGEKIHGFRIPIAQLGEVLLNTQKVPSSISKFVYSQKKEYLKVKGIKNTVQDSFGENEIEETVPEKKSKTKSKSKKEGMLSDQLMYNSQLYAVAMTEGSVRIILASPQPTLNTEVLNDSFTIFKNLVRSGNNKKAVQEQIKKLGDAEPIVEYKRFLSTLYKYNIDIEFSGKTKELNDFDIFKLDHKEAKTIYKTLNKKDDPITEKITKIGMLRAVDLESKRFKFHVDEEDKLIFGTFKKEMILEMEDKTFNETYKIRLETSIPPDNINQKPEIKYELLEFLD